MTPLTEVVARLIARQGPIPFAAYMQMALYHPEHGYYSGAPRTGFRGHFVTAPELDPAFGELWVRGFEQMWEAMDRPARFTLVEIGPGEGGFAAAVLRAAREPFRQALELALVERNPRAQRRQEETLGAVRAAWYASMGEVPEVEGCVFANEVLDNLPVHLVEERDGEVLEVHVSSDGTRLFEVLLPLSSAQLTTFCARIGLQPGQRIEAPLAAAGFARRVAAAVRRGMCVFVDYGITNDELATRPLGTLACYSDSGADDEPLVDPGSKDITSHANWTEVAAALHDAGMEPGPPRPVAEVLRRLGAAEVHDGLRAEHTRALAEGRGADAVRALSRRGALSALLDPGGLGGQQVLAARRDVPPVPLLQDLG